MPFLVIFLAAAAQLAQTTTAQHLATLSHPDVMNVMVHGALSPQPNALLASPSGLLASPSGLLIPTSISGERNRQVALFYASVCACVCA